MDWIEKKVEFLNGCLHAFAWINNKTDHGFSFELDWRPKTSGVREFLEDYLKNKYGRYCGTFDLVTTENDYYIEFLTRWFFLYLDDDGKKLRDDDHSFSFSDPTFRRMFFTDDNEEITRCFRSFGPILRSYEVKTSYGLFDCATEQMLLEYENNYLFLYCGVSD